LQYSKSFPVKYDCFWLNNWIIVLLLERALWQGMKCGRSLATGQSIKILLLLRRALGSKLLRLCVVVGVNLQRGLGMNWICRGRSWSLLLGLSR
jgi:hypothetical protein